MADRNPRLRPGRWLLAALACTVALAAQSAPLSDYFGKALERDPDYLAARSIYEADILSKDLAAAAFLPTVSALVNADATQYNRRDNSGASLQQRFDPLSGTLRLTQPVFDLGRLASMRENEARAVRAELTLMQAKSDLAQKLVTAAFNYLLALDQIALANAQADAFRAQVKQVEGLLASRSATRTDLADARARLELAIAQGRTAESTAEVRRLEFARLTGEPPNQLRPLAATPALGLPDPARVEVWTEAARERNWKVAALQAGVQLAEAAVDRAKAPLYPTLSLVANQSSSRSPNYFTDLERTRSLSAQLNMTLYDGGTTRIQVSQAAKQVDRARHDVDGARHEAVVAAGQGFWGMVNGIEQIRATEQAVVAAELNVEGTRVGIKANVKTFTEELNAVQLLFQARTNLQRERYNYLSSRAQLMLATGLSETGLRALLDSVSP